MSNTDLKSMMFAIRDDLDQESLTLDEKLAIEIIALERQFLYGSESIQRKRLIRNLLDNAIKESEL